MFKNIAVYKMTFCPGKNPDISLFTSADPKYPQGSAWLGSWSFYWGPAITGLTGGKSHVSEAEKSNKVLADAWKALTSPVFSDRGAFWKKAHQVCDPRLQLGRES